MRREAFIYLPAGRLDGLLYLFALHWLSVLLDLLVDQRL
jgi:hypothetical protein